MKKHAIAVLAAAGCSALLLGSTVRSAAADELMNFRLAAQQTAVSVETLAQGDFLTQGNLFIDNYSGISQMRLILKSDAPLVIENGDYVREADVLGPDKKPKVAMFADYSNAAYTQYSAETEEANVMLWYGPETGEGGGNLFAEGVLDKTENGLLQFDLRIPQDTPVGDYSCFISTDVKQIAPTLNPDLVEEDSYVICRRQELVRDTDMLFTPLTVSVYRRGDVNCDGGVLLNDAQAALNLYVSETLTHVRWSDAELQELLHTPHIGAGRRAADASEDGRIGLDDAQGILIYYVDGLTGISPEWERIFK